MKNIIILTLISFIISQIHLDVIMHKKFQKFISKYGKKYSSTEEYFTRYQNFVKNYIKLKSMEKTSYQTGITKFFDMTPSEISNKHLNLDLKKTPFILPSGKPIINAAIPDSFDWRDYRPMPTREPGSCGTNWSFATLNMLEALYINQKGRYVKFSEQMLLDCVTKNNGCDGYVEYALDWIKQNGIMRDSDYAYKGTKGTCKAVPSLYVDMKVTGYRKLGETTTKYGPADENEMRHMLYQKGPYSVGINSSLLRTYTGGILDASNTKCPPTAIDHSCLLVGYGTSNGLDYWILKNSWGKSWGESGYFRVARGKSVCGVNYYAIYADVEFP